MVCTASLCPPYVCHKRFAPNALLSLQSVVALAYFVSSSVGYIAGGMWPSTDAERAAGRLNQIPFRMTQHVDFGM
jgi:hypothetical protein